MESVSVATKILSANQIRTADTYTIEYEPVTSIELMERASIAFVNWFIHNFDNDSIIKIFCGIGNNGGDGLAIARILIGKGYTVFPYIVGDIEKASFDFTINYKRLKSICQILTTRETFPVIVQNDIIIDALFGLGLSRPVEGFYSEVIRHINYSICKSIIAVDIPSGLFSDENTTGNSIVKAFHTITFQALKLCFCLPQSLVFCGDLHVVDIGLDKSYIKQLPSDYYLVNDAFIKSIFKKRDPFIHKGDAGQCLLIVGSKGKIGAGILAAKSCLRSGAGLVTVHTPQCGYIPLQTTVSEVMVITDKAENNITDIGSIDKYDAIGIGPGIGTDEKTMSAFEQFLKADNKPVVIDADALNMLSERKELMEYVPEQSILTPHSGEFKRLAGSWQNDFERLKMQIKFSKKYKVVILLKGPFSSISTPEGLVFFNSVGNSGMATAGSGDVLTGIITSLLGQGNEPHHAAILGAYIHGLSGDIFVNNYSKEGLIAGDLIKYLPEAFRHIYCI